MLSYRRYTVRLYHDTLDAMCILCVFYVYSMCILYKHAAVSAVLTVWTVQTVYSINSEGRTHRYDTWKEYQ